MESTLFQDPAFWLLTLFLVPLILRVPIALSLGVAALMVVWKWDMGLNMLSYNFFAGIAKFPLLAIPFFILAGYIMERAGIASRIVTLMESLMGTMTGGLAIATVAVATFWGAVSGSGPATVAALGLILIPGMTRVGYDRDFAAATVSVTSGLAIVIPPSIAFIVYGGIANVSVPALFAAGFVPGLIVALCIMGAVYLISRRKGYRGKRGTKPVGKAFREAFWGVLTPAVILGGIYGGIFTPTEAAAVAVFWGLFVGIFIYRTINSVKILFEIFSASMQATAVVMIVVTCAGLYSWVASTVGLVERGSALLLSVSSDPWVVLLMINIILLLAGMLLDAISIYYVFLPFMLPIMAHFGWDPIWFGIMMTVNLAVGQVTPPVAVNLYVGANISGLTMEQISKAALPLIGAALLALIVIVLFPGLSTFLPRLLGLS
ncbi:MULTISPECIES: TRAP transporter large permease [unclassified Desulfovibrio]|uniref:TRAP transporter large permease n=1 Tax=unclassified Desulfovibrio TaxID=2593640 RepID=UPI0013EAF3F7|nr:MULTISPECIES: TRAP transporter large permease [unclassified Desulfovibrio]